MTFKLLPLLLNELTKALLIAGSLTVGFDSDLDSAVLVVVEPIQSSAESQSEFNHKASVGALIRHSSDVMIAIKLNLKPFLIANFTDTPATYWIVDSGVIIFPVRRWSGGLKRFWRDFKVFHSQCRVTVFWEQISLKWMKQSDIPGCACSVWR